jgi:hypothetical protein
MHLEEALRDQTCPVRCCCGIGTVRRNKLLNLLPQKFFVATNVVNGSFYFARLRIAVLVLTTSFNENNDDAWYSI